MPLLLYTNPRTALTFWNTHAKMHLCIFVMILLTVSLSLTPLASAKTLSLAGTLTLDSGDGKMLGPAAIDPASGFAYFAATGVDPGRIVKIRLSDFTRVAVLLLNPGETPRGSGVVDPHNGFAYFGITDLDNPGKVVKIRLSDFSRIDTLSLKEGHSAGPAVLDADNGYAYYQSSDVFGHHARMVKISLSDFKEVDAFYVMEREGFQSAVIDNQGLFAYFATGQPYGASKDPQCFVVKISLSDFKRVGRLDLCQSVLNKLETDLYWNADYVETSLIDGQFAYFGTRHDRVVRVSLSDFTPAGVLDLGVGGIRSAVMDVADGFAYFAHYANPGSILAKVRLSSFSLVEELALPNVDYLAWSAAIDTANGYAYLGTSCLSSHSEQECTRASPATIIKLALRGQITEQHTLATTSTVENTQGIVTLTNVPLFSNYGSAHTEQSILLGVALGLLLSVPVATLRMRRMKGN